MRGSLSQQGNLAAIAISGPAVIQFGQLNQSTTNLNGSQSVAILGSAPGRDRTLLMKFEQADRL